jgi:hypothetical protein
MKGIVKTGQRKTIKQWGFIPTEDLKGRFYQAKGERQKTLSENLSDREFLIELIESGLKKFTK